MPAVDNPSQSRVSDPSRNDPRPQTSSGGPRSGRSTIWIDLENTPHIPFFKPIIRELERLGYEVCVTARDAFQVCDLADRFQLPYTKIGRHYGKNRFLKVWGLGWRSVQLLPYVLKHRPILALSHGSRAQILISNLLRIPTVMVMDYEHSNTPPLVRPRWEIVPEVLLDQNLHCRNRDRIRSYRGIKEDVYAPEFRPTDTLLEELELKGAEIIATVRPPATEAHYHNPESEILFVEFMEKVCRTPGVKAVLLPRNKKQESDIRSAWPHWFKNSQVIIPAGAVDGLNLLWHSDLVVSGGGTMNREAAALGVPVYSIFRGKMGAVDRQLQADGRLVMIQNVEDVHSRIPLQRRTRSAVDAAPRQALADIVQLVDQIVKTDCSR